MEDKEVFPLLEQFVDAEIERQKEQEQKYPSDVQNEVAQHRLSWLLKIIIYELRGGEYSHLCKIVLGKNER